MAAALRCRSCTVVAGMREGGRGLQLGPGSRVGVAAAWRADGDLVRAAAPISERGQLTSSSPWAGVRLPSCRIGHVLRHRHPPPELSRVPALRQGLNPAKPAMYPPWTVDGPVVYLRQSRVGSRGCRGAWSAGVDLSRESGAPKASLRATGQLG